MGEKGVAKAGGQIVALQQRVTELAGLGGLLDETCAHGGGERRRLIAGHFEAGRRLAEGHEVRRDLRRQFGAPCDGDAEAQAARADQRAEVFRRQERRHQHHGQRHVVDVLSEHADELARHVVGVGHGLGDRPAHTGRRVLGGDDERGFRLADIAR